MAFDSKLIVAQHSPSKSFEHSVSCEPGLHTVRMIWPTLKAYAILYHVPISTSVQGSLDVHQWQISLVTGRNNIELKPDRLMGGFNLVVNGGQSVKGTKLRVPASWQLSREPWMVVP